MRINSRALQKDVNTYFNAFASTFVKDSIEQLEKEANDYIAYFYNSYSPKKYDRTYDFLDNGVRSYVINKKGAKLHTGWIDLLNDVDGSNYIYSNESLSDREIRMRSWLGIHGESSVKVTTPSPLDYLMYFYYGKKFENSAINKAKSSANSQKYTYLKK